MLDLATRILDTVDPYEVDSPDPIAEIMDTLNNDPIAIIRHLLDKLEDMQA